MTGITANQNILELEEFKYASSIQGIFDFYGPTLESEKQNEKTNMEREKEIFDNFNNNLDAEKKRLE